MKKFEIITGIFALLGYVFKILRYPGGSLLTVTALTLLILFYCCLSFAFFNDIRLKDVFKVKSDSKKSSNQIVAVFSGIVISVLIVGILFKLMIWTGASDRLLTGLILVAVLSVVTFYLYRRSKLDMYVKLFKRFAIYGGLALLLYFIPATTLVDVYYRGVDTDYVELYKKVIEDPHNEELRRELYVLENERLMKEYHEEME